MNRHRLCGYCRRPIFGDPVEILDAMPGEPSIACQPCYAVHRLGVPEGFDQGPGSPCPYCDEASVVDEIGCCVHCGVVRPCSNCSAMTHAYLMEDDGGRWDEDCRYHSKINDDGSTRRTVQR